MTNSEEKHLVGIKYSQGYTSEIITVSDFTITLEYQRGARTLREKQGSVEWMDTDGFIHEIPSEYIFDKVYMEEIEDE